jgi:hypothetical protein
MLKAAYQGDSESITKITADPYNFSLNVNLAGNQDAINRWFYDELNYTSELVNIPDSPDWDLADWWNEGKKSHAEDGGLPAGTGFTDAISVSYMFPGLDPDSSTGSTEEKRRRSPQLADSWTGTDAFDNWHKDQKGYVSRNPQVDGYAGNQSKYKQDPDKDNVNLGFIRKKIYINRPEELSWMADYDVIPEFYNCIPMSQRAASSKDSVQYQGISIQKYRDYFIVQVAFPVPSPQGRPYRPEPGMKGYNNTEDYRTRWHPLWARGGGTYSRKSAFNAYASFAVTNDAMPVGSDGRMTEADYEAATGGDNITQFYPEDAWRLPLSNWMPVIYPTVKFTIIGYPSGFRSESLGGTNPTITLKASK